MPGFGRVEGVAAPYPMANVDTDQILPAEFLKKIDRNGLDRALFHDVRFRPDGLECPEFVLNRAGYRHARILIGGPNFGCGSARETAPWAMLDFGLRCVIAPSFADIFRLNCINNALLPVQLPPAKIEELLKEALPDAIFQIDLAEQTVIAPSGRRETFDIDPRERRRLETGLDPIGATLRHASAIDGFEERLDRG